MPDTFGGEWHRPRKDRRKDRDRGDSLEEVRERASFDNESQLGCGAIFLLCILAVAAVLGIALT